MSTARRGHNVSVVTPLKSSVTTPGLTEIIVQSDIDNLFSAITEEEFVKVWRAGGDQDNISQLFRAGVL